jgi:N-acetylmuramoyl-L-alanine amidase CwlA
MKIQEKLLTINPFSRPGVSLRAVKGIVVHWVANPDNGGGKPKLL